MYPLFMQLFIATSCSLDAPPQFAEFVITQNIDCNSLPWEIRSSGFYTAFRQAGKNLQIAKSYEQSYNYEQFAALVAIFQERHQELENTPMISDDLPLPPTEEINSSIRFNQAFQKSIPSLPASSPRDIILEETRGLYNLYTLLSIVVSTNTDIVTRRSALRHYLEKVSLADYYAGHLPPSVPYWRFRTVN